MTTNRYTWYFRPIQISVLINNCYLSFILFFFFLSDGKFTRILLKLPDQNLGRRVFFFWMRGEEGAVGERDEMRYSYFSFFYGFSSLPNFPVKNFFERFFRPNCIWRVFFCFFFFKKSYFEKLIVASTLAALKFCGSKIISVVIFFKLKPISRQLHRIVSKLVNFSVS